MYNTALRSAIALLYPNRCPFCDGIIGINEYWCDECFRLAELIDSRRSDPPKGISELFACCSYSGSARDAVLRLKEGSYIYAAQAFGALMTEAAGEAARDADMLVPVPCSRKSRMRRGYNPSELIAREMSRRCKTPCVNVLKASKDKLEQKSLNADMRRANAEKSFLLKGGAHVCGKSVMLVDDICTTGSTLSACAALLLNAGAASVSAAVFAKTRADA